MKHIFRSGFTLVELMIVIAIIGILATVLYPNISSYLERSRNVKYQTIATNWIHLIEQYRIDYARDIESEQTNPDVERYCISESVSTNCNATYRHIGLSNYFSSIPDGIRALQDKKKMPFYSETNMSLNFQAYKATPTYWSGNGYILPGMDMTSTDKVEMLTWQMNGGGGYSGVTPAKRVGDNLGITADKICSPGFAIIIGLNNVTTVCGFIFQ